MAGYIKLYRQMTEWEWYKDTTTKVVFLHLLIVANHEDKRWQGKTILRGQRLTSLANLSNELNLSTQQIRTALKKLERTGEIVKKSTNEFTLITICNYDNYQSEITNEQQTNNKRITNEQQTNNNKQECKELKECKEYISTSTTIQANDEKFYRELAKTDTEFFALVCMRLNIESDSYEALLQDFINENRMKEKFHLSMSDAKDHFVNWARMELERKNRPQPKQHNNGKSNNGYMGRGAYEPDPNKEYTGHFGD